MASLREERRPAGPPVAAPRTGDAELLVAALRRLCGVCSLQEVISTAAQAARDLLGADGVTFVLREGDQCYYADENAISPLWKGKRFPMDACISGWCMQQRRAVAIRNIYDDGRIPHDAYRPTFVHSLAMVPVRQDEPSAAMGAYWADERNVTSEELNLLQSLADAAALAIVNVELQNSKDDADLRERETAHRAKNILAVALALVRTTNGDTVEEYQKQLAGRLDALDQAQSAMFEARKGVVDMRELLRRLISGYATGRGLEIESDAAGVRLSASEARNIALVVHELSANAAKYGALSTPSGRVSVSCSYTKQGLRLDWREAGGPPVAPPSRIGFGTKLIQRVVAQTSGGQVKLDYPPEGFHCEVLLPLSGG